MTSDLAQNKGLRRAIEALPWDNWGTSKDAPAGAQTPVVPGLTDPRSRLMPTSTPRPTDTPSTARITEALDAP